MKKCGLVLVVVLLALTCATYAQDTATDPSQLSLERIFVERDFSSKRFGPARWLDDGEGYTTLERSGEFDRARDIVRYNTESGEREILVSAERLIPAGDSLPLPIYSYYWSPDKSKLLIFTNTRRVWRYHTRGDYWVLDLNNGKLSQLGGNAEEATLMFTSFSPDSRKVAYVMKHNVYVEDVATNRITALTTNGSETLINGTFDWVYEEEFGLRNGIRWSPDSRSVAYWQIDASGIGEFYMINTTDSIYSKIIPVQYPKVGTTNSACRVGVVSAEGGETVWMKTPGDPRNTYIARMDWAGSSDEIYVQHLNRLQNHLQIMLCDRKSGKTRTVYAEQDSAWIDIHDDMRWVDDGKRFFWVTEKDGWRHIYFISRDGKKSELVTKGDYDIVSIQRVDEDGGWVYFIASPDNATERYLYRVKLDGSSTSPERLSPQDMAGTHSYQISPDASWAIHTVSDFETPATISLVNLPGHKTVRVLENNDELKAKVSALNFSPAEFFQVDIGDGVKLDAWCMYPPNFDESKKYPLFFYVYGEPAGQTVLNRFGRRQFWHRLLAQEGYVVMSVDNRGTPGPRGRTWRKSIYGQIGIQASADQAAAAKEILRTRSYLDPERVGIWGWSGGGSMTLNMLFRHPEIYSTGMAIAFVANQRFYDTIYQERYMGLPDLNPDGFKYGSPVTYAKNLEGNLFIIHGTADDNVHYQSFEVLVNELIKHNKYFTMMSYPDRSHGIWEGANTTRHLFTMMTNYLLEKMPPGPAEEAQALQ